MSKGSTTHYTQLPCAQHRALLLQCLNTKLAGHTADPAAEDKREMKKNKQLEVVDQAEQDMEKVPTPHEKLLNLVRELMSTVAGIMERLSDVRGTT